LFRTAQALAAMAGREFVVPDDVKRMVLPVLGHRLILRPESRLRKLTPAAVLHEIVSEVSVPVPAGQAESAKDEWA
jgi:MoxR-like ATPase